MTLSAQQLLDIYNSLPHPEGVLDGRCEPYYIVPISRPIPINWLTEPYPVAEKIEQLVFRFDYKLRDWTLEINPS